MIKYILEEDNLSNTNYPCLMQGVKSKVIVLMEKPGCGTVLAGISSRGTKVGQYSRDWGDNMVPYCGKITLENKGE